VDGMNGYEKKRKENGLNEARLHFVKAFSMLISDFISFPLKFLLDAVPSVAMKSCNFYGEIFYD
jgi:hypothetical protein